MVETSFTLATEISSFDRVAFRQKLHDLFPQAAEILVHIHAASVVADIRLVMHNEAEARQAEFALARIVAKPANEIARDLSAPVTSATLPRLETYILMGAPSPPPPALPSFPSPPPLEPAEEWHNDGSGNERSPPIAMVAMIVVGSVLATSACLFACVRRMEEKGERSSGTRARRSSAITLRIDNNNRVNPVPPPGPPPEEPTPSSEGSLSSLSQPPSKQSSGIHSLVKKASRNGLRRGSAEEKEVLFHM